MTITHQITVDLATIRGINSVTVRNGSTSDELVVYFLENNSPMNVQDYSVKLITDNGVYTTAKTQNSNIAVFRLNEDNCANKTSDNSTARTLLSDGWNVAHIQLVENGSLKTIQSQKFQIYCEPKTVTRKFLDTSGVFITSEDIELIRKFKDTDFNLLLSVSNDDNGKILQVVNGSWAAVKLVDVSEEGA